MVDYFNKDENIQLDRIIMDSIVKIREPSADPDEQSEVQATNFKIAELWNRPDVAARILVDLGEDASTVCDQDRCNSGIKRALLQGQTQFLDIYLKYGRIELNKFLRQDVVESLYNEVCLSLFFVSFVLNVLFCPDFY